MEKTAKAKYKLTVTHEFAAAHTIHGYDGPCSRPHGHNWEVETKAYTYELNEIGIALDFKELKDIVNEVINIVDHQDLNTISPFDKINPTAENLASWFFKQIKTKLNNKAILKSVTIWETKRSAITYSEE